LVFQHGGSLPRVVESKVQPESRVGDFEQLGWFSNMAAGHVVQKGLLEATTVDLTTWTRRQEHSMVPDGFRGPIVSRIFNLG
jgi:hypothetical protein